MKKLLFLTVCLAALGGCKQEKAKIDADVALQTRDSLNRIITQRDNEINDMMATMNEIDEGFREINKAQGRVSLAKEGEGASDRQRLRENIQFIQSTMQQNRELIEKLKRQLRASSFKSEEFKKTIDNLTAQLQEKDRQLQQLRDELKSKDIHIAELDRRIDGLHDNVDNLARESSQKSQTISAQDKQLNAAWFVFGTKSELKAQGILAGGKVLQSNFNRDYFTKIDIRVDKEIKLYARSARLLTAHPSGTYTLQRDANKQYVLRVTNPQGFWSTSKYLVILVK